MKSRPSLVTVCLVMFAIALASLWEHRERLARAHKAESIRGEELIESATVQQHQINAAAAVVERLASGEVSLAVAVGELEVIHRNRIRAMAYNFGSQFRGRTPSDHEVLAYYAITKIRCRSGNDPKYRSAALARLEDEYRALFDQPVPEE